MKPGWRAGAGPRLPVPLAVPLFAAWAVAVLALSRPWAGLSPRSLVTMWIPDLPASAFAWANLWETAWRLGCGHAAALGVAAAVFGLGLPLTKLIPASRRADTLALSLGAGAAAAIMALLGLGLCGLWWPSVGWAGVAIGCVLATQFRRPAKLPDLRPQSGDVPRWIAAAFGVELVLALAVVAAKAMAIETVFDATAYQLPLPARFAAEHRVVGLPGVLPSGFPMGGPMLTGWLILVGGEPAARAWRFWLVAGTCLLLWRLCAREGAPRGGVVAAALFATFPLTLWLGPATMPDIEVCLLLLAAAAVPGVLARGVIIAAAVAVKAQALFVVPALALAAAGWSLRGRGLRRVAVVAGLAVLGLLPWACRNSLVAGTPAPGYAERVFPPMAPHPPWLAADMERANRAFVVHGWREWVLFPWRISFAGHEHVRPGAVLLLAVPLLLLGGSPASRRYAALAGVAALGWIAVSHNQRYHMATWAFLFLAVMLGAAARRDGAAAARRSRWVAACLAALLVPGAVALLRELPGAVRPAAGWVLGRETPAGTWARTVPNAYGAVAARSARELPPGARILLLEELRGAYWGRPVVFQTHADVPATELVLRSARTPAEAAKRLRQLASFIYESDAEAARLKFRWGYPIYELDAREARVAAGLWARWMEPVFREGPGAVWRVRRVPASTAGSPPAIIDPAAFRRDYGPWTSVTWGGAAGRATRIAQ